MCTSPERGDLRKRTVWLRTSAAGTIRKSSKPPTAIRNFAVGRRLLVRNCRTRRAFEMDHLKALKAYFAAPPAEIRPGIVEGIAEFDEHVQRHEQSEKIFAAGVVNQGLNSDQGAARRQGVVSCADQVHLLFQVPVVENHSHR